MDTIPLVPDRLIPASLLMARAFQSDPFFKYAIPDEERRTLFLPWLFRRLLSYGLRYGRVDTTPNLEGIAIWLGPDKPRLMRKGILLTGLFLLPLHLNWSDWRRSVRLDAAADKIHDRVLTGKHWYLFELAVDPICQGRGVGGELLCRVLALADRDRLPCYLETNNEKNLPFYQRHGFRVAGRGDLSEPGPQPWGMVSEPGGVLVEGNSV